MSLFRRLKEKIFWGRSIALLSLVFFLTTFTLFFFEGSRDEWNQGAKQCGDLFQHYAAGVFWSEGRVEALYRDFQLGDWINEYRERSIPDSEPPTLQDFNYVYSPLIARVSSAGTGWPFSTWIIASLIFNVLAYLLSYHFLRLTLRLGGSGQGDLPLLFFLGFSSFYYAVIPGQNTVLSLLILSSSGWLLTQKRPLLAGLVASCLCYKPQFIPFIGLTTLLCGQWRFALSTGVGCLAWTGIGVLICGAGSYQLWLESLSNMGSGVQFQRDGLNQSWRGLLLSLVGEESPWIRFTSLLLPMAGCGLISLAWWRRLGLMKRRHPALPLLAAMTVFLLTSPYVGHYDLLLGLPLWLYALDRHPLKPFHIVILALFWLSALFCVSGMFSGISLSAIPVTLFCLAALFNPDWKTPSPVKE
jgi:hypothetical protein